MLRMLLIFFVVFVSSILAEHFTSKSFSVFFFILPIDKQTFCKRKQFFLSFQSLSVSLSPYFFSIASVHFNMLNKIYYWHPYLIPDFVCRIYGLCQLKKVASIPSLQIYIYI